MKIIPVSEILPTYQAWVLAADLLISVKQARELKAGKSITVTDNLERGSATAVLTGMVDLVRTKAVKKEAKDGK